MRSKREDVKAKALALRSEARVLEIWLDAGARVEGGDFNVRFARRSNGTWGVGLLDEGGSILYTAEGPTPADALNHLLLALKEEPHA
jgi:hypothetical protein